MACEDAASSTEGHLIRVEPEARIVVLARTIQARDPGWETAWRGGAPDAGSCRGCIGRALYRHRSVFRGASDAPAWSHLELRYFRGVVPAEAVRDLALAPRPTDLGLLRAEILLTTPSSFVMPRDWRGPADRPGRVASLEYIHVRPDRLDDYRDIMRRHVGPAAARLVAAGTFGTFRAMETAAVLFRAPAFDVDWNQIHLCEVREDFGGFGAAFDAALRETATGTGRGTPPEGGFAAVFAGLEAMRSIPRWTFNHAVAGDDGGIGRPCSGTPSSA